MQDFIDWLRSDIAHWAWALLAGVAGALSTLGVAIYRLWKWLHHTHITTPMTRADAAVLAQSRADGDEVKAVLNDHLHDAALKVQGYDAKLETLMRSHNEISAAVAAVKEDVRREVAVFRADIVEDVSLIRADVAAVKKQTGEHALSLRELTITTSTIAKQIDFLHQKALRNGKGG